MKAGMVRPGKRSSPCPPAEIAAVRINPEAFEKKFISVGFLS